MLDELTRAIEQAHTGTPEQSVESAIMVYLAAQAEIDKYATIQAEAKSLIADVMAETGKAKYNTKCGSASISSAGQSIAYNTAALDALCASMPDLASVLTPHRKVSERTGTMRITAAK